MIARPRCQLSHVAMRVPRDRKRNESSAGGNHVARSFHSRARALLGLCLESMPSFAQAVPETEWLPCGEGVAGDIAWSPGVNEGKRVDFVDNCYLIKHAQGWFLWDTGVADAIASMPEGQRPADPRDSSEAAEDPVVTTRAVCSNRPRSSSSRFHIRIPIISAMRPISAIDLPGAKGRIRLAGSAGASLQAGSAGEQARHHVSATAASRSSRRQDTPPDTRVCW